MNRFAITALAVAPLLIAVATGCTAPDKGQPRSSPTPWWSAAPTTTTPMAAPPTPADFNVGVIVTEQKCFGSAGCNYRYTINPQHVSAKPLPAKTTVVFKVTGGDQAQIGNFTIDADGTATFNGESSISGPENTTLQASVTQVIPGR